ncbi:MAG: lamin tail domain-containing protein [Chloroflexi bacterium]|nr:lamin tail domain-containing protein [Chloroflexota bacterium]
MPLHRLFVVIVALAMALAAIVPMVSPPAARATSSSIVITQVYGGGGNSGATYTHDFIELFNLGTTAVDVSTWSVQYTSAAGTSWARTNLSGIIQPGAYFLVQQAQGAGGTAPLPTSDATGTTAMSATAGKVALVTNQVTLSGCGSAETPCLPSASILDFVGYGSGATESETAPAPTLSNTTSARRLNSCVDSDNNAADFAAGAPTSRNSATVTPCGAETDPSGIGAANPSTVEQGGTSLLTVTVTPGANPTSTGLAVSADLTAIGGSATQAFFDNGTNGDPTAGDNVFSFSAVVSTGTTPGAKSLPATIGDSEARAGEATINLTVIAPAEPTEIHEIQGAGHTSPLVGQTVFRVEGVVTAVRPQSFYMTDPTPDADDATSDGILVFRGSAPGVGVGDLVQVNGRVGEFRPGGSGSDNLTTTQLTNPSSTNPIAIRILSSDNTLPVTLVGTGGRVPPGEVIDNDSAGGSVENAGGTFDPAQDGIDFWESLEGQYLRVNNAVAVGPTNDFGEIPVVGDGGANAGPRTSRGGVLITPTDFNPERIILDDALLLPASVPDMNVGDTFTTSVFGVLDYDFGNFKLLVTANLVRVDSGLTREVAAPTGSRHLSIDTFNVENLDPNPADGEIDDVARLGALIARNLASPDILAIEEIQDNSGGFNDGTTAADLSWGSLISAIASAGGPTYEYRQIDPVNNSDGGQPGGNIRVGFLFRADRGVHFVDRPGGTSLNETDVLAVEHGRSTSAQLTFSPGRIGTDDRAFNQTRKSLAGEFRWRGETIFVVANHFSSKGGDDPLFGRWQPPVRYTEFENPAGTDADGWRHGQAQVINGFVDEVLAIEPDANVVVLGDINDFQFSRTVEILTGAADGAPVLTTLFDQLPLNEQYSYVFDGNSQVLDQILVSDAVLARSPTYDVVHVNAEFFDQASDHDPSVMRVAFQPRRGK